jgi:hypothetical protein
MECRVLAHRKSLTASTVKSLYSGLPANALPTICGFYYASVRGSQQQFSLLNSKFEELGGWPCYYSKRFLACLNICNIYLAKQCLKGTIFRKTCPLFRLPPSPHQIASQNTLLHFGTPAPAAHRSLLSLPLNENERKRTEKKKCV